MAILWLVRFIRRGPTGAYRLCLLEDERRGMLMVVLGAGGERMDLVVGMGVGMAVVGLEAREEEEVVVTVVVVGPWVLRLHLETGDVASDPMLTVEAEAAAVVVSGAEETATSGLNLPLCHV